MEQKKFSKFELARMKRTAMNLNSYISKKHKLQDKITALVKELEEVNKLIEVTDAPTKELTGGYGTEEILKRKNVVISKNGVEQKLVKYEFIYPETIIPPVPYFQNEIENGEEPAEEVKEELN